MTLPESLLNPDPELLSRSQISSPLESLSPVLAQEYLSTDQTKSAVGGETGLSDEFVTPWSSVGYLTFKRTYARRLSEDSDTTEEWPDTIRRIVRACREQLNVGFSDDEEIRLTKYMLTLKGTVAGRFLWQLGTDTVDRLGLLSLQNCAFTTVNEPVRPFTWAMDCLMLGSGVGANVQREYVYKLPPVVDSYAAPVRYDNAGADFIVPDTREGWVNLLERTLAAAFDPSAKRGFTYSTQLIRGKGTPIKGFGGVASGPEDLVAGIGEISAILERRAGKQLRPIDCADIICCIGAIVVAGNVRRSAIILLGDHDDIQYLRAKRWDLGNIPNYRAMSNNSVVCNDIALLPDEFWEGYRGNGEPYGLINLKLARACGRLGETQYKDKGVRGFNPCAEQSLEDYETCCLAELYLPNISSPDELLDVATLLYRINKHSLALPCHHPETESIVHRNMRMGIGVTGYLQATEDQRSWLKETYERLREYDKVYSAERSWPSSIKLTTVKPSGTLSLLPGVTPGIHPAYARHLIRRIRFASNSPIVETCRAKGYRTEFQRRFDGTEDHGTVVVEFPFAYPEGTTLASEMTAVSQLEVIKRLQKEWSDNAVSCTIYYRKEELDEVRAYLAKNYNRTFKSLSFLLHSDHGFDQAPLEEISEEEYNQLISQVELITSIEEELEFDPNDECASGACPIR
jgi:ribonucleoside-triphosphate reductase